MPRPRIPRYVHGRPIADGFHPDRLPPWGREEVVLPLEGLEAIRLSDFEGLGQEEAAGRMSVSRQTFGRVLAQARRVVAEALVLGKVLRIEGGDFEMPPWGRGRHGRRRGRGQPF